MSEAIFSPDRKYRYTLWRDIQPDLLNPICRSGYVQFIGLNPSIADEVQDDNTIRRLRDYSSRWGFKRMLMTNLYAYRATEPKDMQAQKEPIGPDNDEWLFSMARKAEMVVACWGRNGQERGRVIATLMRNKEIKLHVFRLLKGNVPEHPLMLPKTLEPQLWFEQ